MLYAAIDTETTGLPADFKARSTDPSMPYIVELSAALFDGDDEIASVSRLIAPGEDDWTIDPEAQAKHGITVEKCREKGEDIKVALAEFFALCDRADLLVGHNVSFDKRMVRVAMFRNGYSEAEADAWKARPDFCTMYKGAGFLRDTGQWSERSIKLDQLYRVLFQESLPEHHRSLADARAAARCYRAIAPARQTEML